MLLPVLVGFVAPWQIVPGRSLGMIEIGKENKEALPALGKATSEDGAMGRFWSTWVGKGGGRLDVYSHRNDVGDRVPVEIVRATSPRFRLTNGLHPGSPASDLRKAYPGAKRAGFYTAADGRVDVWDEPRKGLAWEVDPKRRTLALLVHRAGSPLSAADIGPYVSSPIGKG